MRLILPGDPLFDYTLATTPPPGWKSDVAKHDEQVMMVARAGSGLLEVCDRNGVGEYLEEEYEQRLAENEEWDEYYEEMDVIL